MPILWRYLMRSYFQVFILCVLAFIAVLLVIRFQDIASFASSGAPILSIAQFTLYQIPYILPIAVPISCLISAMLLLQRLSHTHELTALRTCGLGIKPIAFPLILAGSFLSLVNFTISSEIAPMCHRLSKELIYEITTVNPLFLLQKETLVRLKNAHANMKVLHMGKQAEDVIFVINNRSQQRLGLMTAKELSLKNGLLVGENVTFISSVDSKKTEGFDHIIIENQKTMSTKAANLSQFLQKTDWTSSYDNLNLRMVQAKSTVEKKRNYVVSRHFIFELSRRLSFALAALTFTVIGIAFGVDISRNRTKKGLLWALSLTCFFMVCFIAAKSFRHHFFIASLVYILPHPLLILCSIRFLKQRAEGIE